RAFGGFNESDNHRFGPPWPARNLVVSNSRFVDRLAIRTKMVRARGDQRLLLFRQRVVGQIDSFLMELLQRFDYLGLVPRHKILHCEMRPGLSGITKLHNKHSTRAARWESEESRFCFGV